MAKRITLGLGMLCFVAGILGLASRSTRPTPDRPRRLVHLPQPAAPEIKFPLIPSTVQNPAPPPAAVPAVPAPVQPSLTPRQRVTLFWAELNDFDPKRQSRSDLYALTVRHLGFNGRAESIFLETLHRCFLELEELDRWYCEHNGGPPLPVGWKKGDPIPPEVATFGEMWLARHDNATAPLRALLDSGDEVQPDFLEHLDTWLEQATDVGT